MRSIRKPFTMGLIAEIALTGILFSTGCQVGNWNSGASVSRDVRVDVADNLSTRTVTKTISIEPGQTIRLTHLAGDVHLQQSDVDQAQLRAVVHAQAENDDQTQRMLDAMTWTTRRKDGGDPTWTLNWPTDRDQTYHYSVQHADDQHGFKVTSDAFLNRKLTVTTQRDPGVPTLYAELTVMYPQDGGVDVRVLAGDVSAASLTNQTAIETAFGDVTIDRIEGESSIDTAVGAIQVRELNGKASFDTGSGNVVVETLNGSGQFDTGSGNITMGSLVGSGHFDTGSGDIHIKACDADAVYADTGSGAIRIENGRVDRVEADTGSGSITLDAVEFTSFLGDTGSGDIRIVSTLTNAKRIQADTGSGSVTIHGGADASFHLTADLGSGDMTNGYDDVSFVYDDDEFVGVRRGDQRTRIKVDTGSGGCVIRP